MKFMPVFLSLVCLFAGNVWGQAVENSVFELVQKAREENAFFKSDPLFAEVLAELQEKGYVERVGDDATLRPIFVMIQGFVEETFCRLLESNPEMSIRGTIHTPCPATPLCTDGTISDELIDPALAFDPKRLQTVVFRAQVMRRYLDAGGKLGVVYPEEGMSKRTPEQQGVYRDLLARYPKVLVDMPIQRPVPQELIGATYLVYDGDGHQKTLFGIRAVQANAPSDGVTWKLWLGEPQQNKECQACKKSLIDFLKQALFSI